MPLTGPQKEVLTSKLALLRSGCVDRTRTEILALERELAERGMSNSGERIARGWAIIRTNGLETANTMLDTCFQVGVRDAAEAASIVRDEYVGFLRSWSPARSGSSGPEIAEMHALSTATSMGARIDDEARSRLFDVLARQPRAPATTEHSVDVWTKKLKRTGGLITAATALGAAIWKLMTCGG